MRKFHETIPAVHRKVWIISGFFAAIGAVVGSYISVLKGNFIYAAIGISIGYITGIIISFLIQGKCSLRSLVSAENNINFIAGLISLLMSIVAVVAFAATLKWKFITGILFFSACGIYLLTKKEQG